MSKDKAGSPHLGEDNQGLKWDWWGENPVEIILVAFILILFFTLPRMGCGIDKSQSTADAPDNAAQTRAAEQS